MKCIYVALLLFFSSFQCQSQTKSVEEIYEDCYFNAMPKQGKQLKKYAKKYEISLIENDLLKDDSSESYYNLFKKIFMPGFVDDKTNFHFIDSVNALTYINLVHSNKRCINIMKSLSNYRSSRTYQLEKRSDSINKSYSNDIEKNTDFVLNFYNKEDFELDYYKLRVLLLIPDEIPLFEKEIEYSNEQLKESLRIELIKGDKVLVKSTEVSLAEMKTLVKNYIKTKKAKSLIHISSERDVLYSYYIGILENLNVSVKELKNEISISKFHKKFDELTNLQKELIDKEYSFEISEQLID